MPYSGYLLAASLAINALIEQSMLITDIINITIHFWLEGRNHSHLNSYGPWNNQIDTSRFRAPREFFFFWYSAEISRHKPIIFISWSSKHKLQQIFFPSPKHEINVEKSMIKVASLPLLKKLAHYMHDQQNVF